MSSYCCLSSSTNYINRQIYHGLREVCGLLNYEHVLNENDYNVTHGEWDNLSDRPFFLQRPPICMQTRPSGLRSMMG